jgi:hypothetical protein
MRERMLQPKNVLNLPMATSILSPASINSLNLNTAAVWRKTWDVTVVLPHRFASSRFAIGDKRPLRHLNIEFTMGSESGNPFCDENRKGCSGLPR